MAFPKSLPNEQIPLGCQLCEGGNKIGWKCFDCNLLMCDRCKDIVHLRIAKDHRIVNIKEIREHDGSWSSFVFGNLKCEDHSNQQCSLYCKTCNLVQEAYQHYGILKQEEEIENLHVKNEFLETIITSRDFIKFLGDFDNLYASLNEDLFQDTINNSSFPNFVPAEFTVLNFGSLEGKRRFRENHFQVQFKVTNQWTTDLRNIHYMIRCLDGTLWIADNCNEVLQHIKLENDNVKVLSSFSMKIFGLVDISSNILVSTEAIRLKSINERTKQITDSAFNVGPLISRDIHITRDRKVIISARSTGPRFPATGRRMLIVMDQAGKRIIKHENDSNNKPLFTLPYQVTSTRNGNICVVDRINSDCEGRVVVIGQEGNIKGIYIGHQHVNTEDKPFKPQGILATPSDNILVTDWLNHCIHILNHDGDFISYYSLKDLGIQYPCSLALSTSGQLYIGSTCSLPFLKTFRGKLYKVEYS